MEFDNMGQVFDKAARIIQRRGKAEGSWGTVDGPVCTVGAIREVDGGNPGRGSTYSLLHERALGNFINRSATSWSDTNPKHVVVSTLRLAAYAYDDLDIEGNVIPFDEGE